MSSDKHDQEIRKFVAAFADGELDIEHTIEVLSRLSMDPATTARVDHQQQLREAVARVMVGPECKNNPTRCPDLVKAEIRRFYEEHADDPPASADKAASPHDPASTDAAQPTASPAAPGDGVAGRIRRWTPLLIAAALLILVTTMFFGRQVPVTPFNGSIIEVNLGKQFAQRHAVCTINLTDLVEHESFPDDIADLPDKVASVMGDGAATPMPLDLSKQGYRYMAAGLCEVPGDPAVHVVYHPMEGGSDAALSLWITPDTGRLADLQPGRLYLAHMPADEPRLMVWRHDGIEYYLMGEAMADVESATEVLWARGISETDRQWLWELFVSPDAEADSPRYALRPRAAAPLR